MTQTQPAPPPRATPSRREASAVAGGAPVRPSAAPQPRSGWPTPVRLRAAALLTVLVALVCGGLGWQAAHRQATAVSEVQTGADRVVAVQDVRNNLVAADAIATNGFLVGGLEPVASRQEYTARVDAAAGGLAALSFPDRDDTSRVAAADALLTRYTGLVEQARAANRQGLPVGSAYLDQASTLMRANLLPALDTLTLSGADATAGGFDAVADAPWLLLGVLLGLAVLVGVQLWDSRRTHRVLNVGLTGAAVAVLVGLLVSIGLCRVSGTTNDVRTGSYRTTLAVSQAVSQAYDARAMESFTLILHGSGAAYETRFQAAAAEADRQLDRAPDNQAAHVRSLFDAWVALHHEIRAKDDGGDWDGAVALAVASGPGTSAAAFGSFTSAAQDLVDGTEQQTRSDLHAARTTATWVGWVLAAAGLAAAGLSWWGLGRRLEEYR